MKACPWDVCGYRGSYWNDWHRTEYLCLHALVLRHSVQFTSDALLLLLSSALSGCCKIAGIRKALSHALYVFFVSCLQGGLNVVFESARLLFTIHLGMIAYKQQLGRRGHENVGNLDEGPTVEVACKMWTVEKRICYQWHV